LPISSNIGDIMEIKDLQPRQGKVELTATLSDKGDVRTIEKPNFSGRVCNAKLTDATGTVKITLWNDQVDQVNNGDTVKISNGYVSEYQGEMQLSTGKFGQLEVVTKAADVAPVEAPAAPTAMPDAPASMPEESVVAPQEEAPLEQFGAPEEVVQ
jgi:replication factor A1